MPYSIDRYNGTTLTVVEDGTIDNTLDIKLIGKNYAGYGEVQNENFVNLLENFSGTSAPPRPLTGQIWYDSSVKKIKYYSATGATGWKTAGGAEVKDTAPSGLTEGDFWWDSGNDQLYAFNGASYVLVGPQGVAGAGTTQMTSRSVRDTLGSTHAIIAALVDGDVVYITSSDPDFTLDNDVNEIAGFSVIKQGLTLVNTGVTGITSSSHKYWGTASNSLLLAGRPASDFVLADSSIFTGVVRFADPGFTVGDSNDLAIYIDGGTTPYFKNAISDTIVFQTTSTTVRTPLKLVANDLLPGTDGVSNIGSTTFKYGTVYANAFNGVATAANTLNVGGTYRSASVASLPSTVVVRDASANINANLFEGVATSARYADLAEKYLTDVEYEVGTVVVVGGDKEVTASSWGQRAVGVVSGSPAYMMNSELAGGTYIALKGRVPVKVVGAVKKGDRLIASNNGCASAAVPHANDVFGIALETNNSSEVKLVECVVL
jgi:hypothetical protein